MGDERVEWRGDIEYQHSQDSKRWRRFYLDHVEDALLDALESEPPVSLLGCHRVLLLGVVHTHLHPFTHICLDKRVTRKKGNELTGNPSQAAQGDRKKARRLSKGWDTGGPRKCL